ITVSAGAAGTTLINSVTTSSQIPDDNSENNTSITGTDVPGGNSADVSVIKTGPASASPNTDVTYTIQVSNGGPYDAYNVSWTDNTPTGAPAGFPMTFVNFQQTGGPSFGTCSTPAIGSTGTITCPSSGGVTLPKNTTAFFTVTVHIPSGAPSGTI